ncbi:MULTISPECIES: hypothetical protein [Bradyrhizobium]|uniref:hypothetical protein n=1 Tax=Bradyrhizobium TaxID=374 RepID=UPI00048FD8E9|nr:MULTISPECIES: hypothetical protein [Bradyrhizobium]UGY28938.1 hypothetical protein HU675_0020410 [Bradyrhizobium septentrionale]
MSDGPYKSLNMTPAWKKFAEWAHKDAFEPDQIAGRVVPALEETWRDEGCGEVVRAIRAILGDAQQTDMFGQNKSVELEAARRDLSAGYPMRRLVVDHVIQSVSNGKLGIDAVNDGVENALRDRAARGPRQVEEHYLRKQSPETTATRVRNRMEEAVASAPIAGLARRLSGLDAAAAQPHLIKQQGIDDGVRLP